MKLNLIRSKSANKTSIRRRLSLFFYFQAEEYSRQTNVDDALTASNSEVFPEDFEDCVEEEIFNMKP